MSFATADVSGPPLALTMMLLVLGLGTGIAVWAVTQAAKHRRHSETLRVQAELQLRLLDKVSTSDELRGCEILL